MGDVVACIESLLASSELTTETLGNLEKAISIQTQLISAQNEQIVALMERVAKLETGKAK